jgi:hypothetical protein
MQINLVWSPSGTKGKSFALKLNDAIVGIFHVDGTDAQVKFALLSYTDRNAMDGECCGSGSASEARAEIEGYAKTLFANLFPGCTVSIDGSVFATTACGGGAVVPKLVWQKSGTKAGKFKLTFGDAIMGLMHVSGSHATLKFVVLSYTDRKAFSAADMEAGAINGCKADIRAQIEKAGTAFVKNMFPNTCIQVDAAALS